MKSMLHEKITLSKLKQKSCSGLKVVTVVFTKADYLGTHLDRTRITKDVSGDSRDGGTIIASVLIITVLTNRKVSESVEVSFS